MWRIVLLANLGVAAAYFAIFYAIAKPLAETGQLRSNQLGLATSMIFLTCGLGHAFHASHLLLPSFGGDIEVGLAARTAAEWHVALADVATVVVGIYYWSMRRAYGPLMRGAALFADLRERQRQALEINDAIVQGLAVAKMSLELGDHDRAMAAIDTSLVSARGIISGLVPAQDAGFDAGQLVRTRAADLRTP